MKTKYYLCGTVLGLCLIPLVAIYILSVKHLLQFLAEWRFLVAMTAGYLSALLVAALADRFLHRQGIIATISILVGVFTAGVFASCVMNLMLSGYVLNPRFGIGNEIWAWFVKPAYWLMLIGAPCAAVVAVLYYCTLRLLNWRARENRYS